MAGGREIKTKIKSVQNTRKVTRALEMVSASKIRKAQERMRASRPYARAMKQKQYQPMSIAYQALSIYAVDKGFMDDVPVNRILAFEEALHAHFANTQGALIERINGSGDWNDEIEAAYKAGIEEFKKTGSW